MQQFSEIKEIMKTEDIELDIANKYLEKILDDAFIKDCSENGIKRYEDILKIVPNATDSLEARKLSVLRKWNNVLPYTYRMLLKKLEVLYGVGNYEVLGDLQRYKICVIVHSELRGQKKTVETMLDDLLPMNMMFSAKNEVLRYFSVNILEEMNVSAVKIRIQCFFWSCNILNGAKFLDGSALLNARKRYDLILGIKNSIKINIKENVNSGGLFFNIPSCFVVSEKVHSANVIKNAINFIEIIYSAKASIKTTHGTVVRTHERIGDVTITYRRNLHYLDGTERLDGSRLLNAFYGKEMI